MRALAASLLVLISVCVGPAGGEQINSQGPRLLLAPRLLRRLQRDRERQTVRWLNFEKRVKTVPDSAERGFELALFFAVTKEEERGREALEWASAHPCEGRQVALALDWAGELASGDQRRKLGEGACHEAASAAGAIPALRDSLFRAIAAGTVDADQLASWNKRLIETLPSGRATDAETLYAAAEYLLAARSVTHDDPRRAAAQFFSLLPREFLLAMKPEQVEHPDWMRHSAALALVNVDPNLEGSQFLQGWALNDRQIQREGPGVAYEFLWADPYLPGIAYDNLDPWVYDPAGKLFARKDWNSGACWISVLPDQFQQQNCPALAAPSSYGTLTLVGMTGACLDLPQRKNNETLMIWKLKPHQPMTFEHGKQHGAGEADAAGLWMAPVDAAGKICLGRTSAQIVNQTRQTRLIN